MVFDIHLPTHVMTITTDFWEFVLTLDNVYFVQLYVLQLVSSWCKICCCLFLCSSIQQKQPWCSWHISENKHTYIIYGMYLTIVDKYLYLFLLTAVIKINVNTGTITKQSVNITFRLWQQLTRYGLTIIWRAENTTLLEQFKKSLANS
jgi:hypothetical protein